MIVDRYTKLVLTIIAASLLWLCAMTVGRPAQAQQLAAGSLPGGAVPVMIVGWGSVGADGTVSVQYANGNGPRRTDSVLQVRAAAPLPVTLPYTEASPLPAKLLTAPANPVSVQVSAIGKFESGRWDPIRVQVEDAPPRQKPGVGDR